MTERAVVWKAGERAGTVGRERAGTTFRYDESYAGPAIATSLPLDVGEVWLPGGALPPFFSGLLPEGRRLTALRRAVKTSADDELSLLLAVGSDLAGDVQVMLDREPDGVPSDVRPLEEVDFVELFARAVGLDLEDRAGIAGAQDKVSGQMISVPVRARDAEWILKFDPPEFPHLVANEAFFLEAARQSGLQVAHAEVVHDVHGVPGLLVRRFDRVVEHGVKKRLAQEDACQVLGRYPADKYRVGTEDVIRGLASRTGAPIVAARDLIRQFAFAYLTCNGDAHAKNFSILFEHGEWRVTPAYDLPVSFVYGDLTMALSLQGERREDIGREDFLALGAECEVPPKAVARVLDQLLDAMPRWLDRLQELPFDERRVHKLRKACLYRAGRLSGG